MNKIPHQSPVRFTDIHVHFVILNIFSVAIMILVLLLFIPQLCAALSLTAQQRRSQHDTLSTKPELLPRGAVPDGIWWTLYGLRNTLQLPECASDACLNAEVLAEKCDSMQCTVSIFWGSFCLSQAFLINSTCAEGGDIFNYTTSCSESCTLARTTTALAMVQPNLGERYMGRRGRVPR